MDLKTKGVIAILLAATIWGTSGVVYKSLYTLGWSVFLIAFSVAVMSHLFTHALAIVKKKTHTYKITRRQKFYCMVNGIANISAIIFFILAIEQIAIADAIFLLYTMPIWVMVLAMLFLKERATPLKVIALCTGIIGIFAITGIGFSDGFSLNLGVTFAIISSFAYTIDVLTGRKLKDISSYAATVWASAAQAIFLLPFLFFTIHLITPQLFITGFIYVFMIYGLLRCFSALFYYYSLEVLQASTVGLLAILDAVASALFAFIIFSEVPTITALFGYMLIISSTGLVMESLDLWHLPGGGAKISGQGLTSQANVKK